MTKDFSEGFVSPDIDTKREWTIVILGESLKLLNRAEIAIYKLDLKVYIELIFWLSHPWWLWNENSCSNRDLSTQSNNWVNDQVLQIVTNCLLVYSIYTLYTIQLIFYDRDTCVRFAFLGSRCKSVLTPSWGSPGPRRGLSCSNMEFHFLSANKVTARGSRGS